MKKIKEFFKICFKSNKSIAMTIIVLILCCGIFVTIVSCKSKINKELHTEKDGEKTDYIIYK